MQAAEETGAGENQTKTELHPHPWMARFPDPQLEEEMRPDILYKRKENCRKQTFFFLKLTSLDVHKQNKRTPGVKIMLPLSPRETFTPIS